MDRDVGVVVLRLGELAHPVDEDERSLKSSNVNSRSSASSTSLQPSGSAIRPVSTIEHEPWRPRPKRRPRCRSPARRRTGPPGSSSSPTASARSPRSSFACCCRSASRPPWSCSSTWPSGWARRRCSRAGGLVGAAVLLQVKTLLDNADGLLARASGQVTLLGRYLDTEADLVVNAAVFVALGSATHEPWLASPGSSPRRSSSASTSTWRALPRGASDVPSRPSSGGGRLEHGLSLALPRRLRAAGPRRPRLRVDGVSTRALVERIPVAPRRATLAYHDRLDLGVLANLGLSTQLAVLGACLVAGSPRRLSLARGRVALPPARGAAAPARTAARCLGRAAQGEPLAVHRRRPHPSTR